MKNNAKHLRRFFYLSETLYVIILCHRAGVTDRMDYFSSTGNVAFSARLHKDMNSTVDQDTVVFGTIVTNIGSAYDSATGIFKAQTDGIYVFAWTILTTPGNWFISELVVDGVVKLYNAANSIGVGKSYESSGCTGVLQLKAGQKVWIRKFQWQGNFLASDMCSFTGWQIQ